MIEQNNEQANLQLQNLQEDSHLQESCMSEEENKKGKCKNNPHINNGFTNRKRREIKMEKDELTSIFSDLIAFVNTRVHFIENEGHKINPPSNLLSLKSKKSIKQKKDEKQRQTIPPQFPDIPIRKNSLKEQKNTKSMQDYAQQKQQLFSNYPQIMQYRIHQNEEKLDLEREIPGAFPYKHNLDIFQSHSFSLNPLFFQVTD